MNDKKIFITRSSMPEYEEYIEMIKPLWDSHWLTNMGSYHKELEKELTEYLDVPEVSLMVNGHMALEMTIQAMGFTEGSEVITTPFTFISTTHAIVRNKLIPVFCDVKEEDGTIDESKIEALITEKTVAIIPVHVYGNICNVEEIQRIADKYNLKVIYDAAHAFGEKYKGVGVGNFGDASIFSFHATKVFNTIEGGAATFSDHRIYEKLYNLKNFGIHGEELVSDVGANAKMNEFCAVMGLCNLKNVNQNIENRRQRFDWYRELLCDVKGIRFWKENQDIERNYAYFPIIITDEFKKSRNEVYDELHENNIYPRKYFYPLTCKQQIYMGKYDNDTDNLEIAENLSKRVLCLPFHAEIAYDTMKEIVEILKK